MGIAGLRQRVITAIYFGIIVIGLIMIHPYTCAILLLIITFGSAYEYEKTVRGLVKGSFIWTALVGFIFGMFIENIGHSALLLWISLMSGIWLFISLFKSIPSIDHMKYGPTLSILYIGIPLGIFSMYLLLLPEYKMLLLTVLTMIWISDSGAYILGSQFGKNKLLPSVSPNKTIEGFLGAMIVALIAGILFYYTTGFRSLYWWMILAVVVWLVGAIGDLAQSGVKRKYGVKDTGRLLPGHGGFWDRFDSFIMIVPYGVLLEKLNL